MDGFEGYVGIGLWEGQWIDDLVLSLLLALFAGFAYFFHRDNRLFFKMVKDLYQVKTRKSLFEEPVGSDRLFHSFMVFQALFLNAVVIFEAINVSGILTFRSVGDALPVLLLLFFAVFVFYECKALLYLFIGKVFATAASYELWHTGYKATIGIWGVLLYIPVCMFAFSDIPYQVTIVLSLFLYVASRIVIIYKTIHIFSLKKDGILYFSLYLCGQEIMPLLLLYAGVVYLYNFIELNALWR